MSYAKKIYEEERMAEIAEANKKRLRDWRLEELVALEKKNQTENKDKPKN
jgi:hypothetical protein